MSTISEALVATAVGLVVAIPAVAAFNYFQGRLAQAMEGADTLGHVLLAHCAVTGDARGHAEPTGSRAAASTNEVD
jgi:biopolymer transport protein ExbB